MTIRQPFPRATPEEVGIPSAAIGTFLNQVEQNGYELHSLMVLRHGRVCAEGWWKPYGPDKLHNIHSFTKTFLATALGIAVAQDRLSIEDDVLSFFPEDAPADPGEHLREMKIRHLLTMNTGHHTEPPVRDEKDFVRAFLAAPVAHRPGSWFVYNSNASHMIGRIIHKVTGKTFLEVLQDNLFEPMGFGPVECSLMADGFPAGGGGLALTTEDLARLAQLYLNRGAWNGEQLLPAAWVDAATVTQSDNSNGLHRDGNADWEAGYGYQLWIEQPYGGLQSYRFDGAHSQIALICPERDAIVLFTAGTHKLKETLRLVRLHLLSNLYDGPLPANPGCCTQLRERLAALALPELQPKGTSLLQAGVDGRRIAFGRNTLMPLAIFHLGSVARAPEAGVDWVEPRFEKSALRLRLQAAGTLYEIEAGMDGDTRANTLSIAGEAMEFHASARWTDQNVLAVTWRPLRVVQSTTLEITYHLDGVQALTRHFPYSTVDTAEGAFA